MPKQSADDQNQAITLTVSSRCRAWAGEQTCSCTTAPETTEKAALGGLQRLWNDTGMSTTAFTQALSHQI